MAKYENQVHYSITTSYDSSGLNQVQRQLASVRQEIERMGKNNYIYGNEQYNTDINRLKQFQTVLTKSFTTINGQFSLTSFEKALKNSNLTLKDLQATFSRAGTTGKVAMAGIVGQMSSVNTQVKQTSKLTEQMMNTLGNTVRWGIVAAGFQSVMSSIQSAVNYVKQLDDSLTQITMVSGQSRDNMKDFAQYANQAAANLGSATTDYTDAVKVFIQEGFSLEESKKQAEQATILGNVSEQDTATTSDQITAYRNAFGLSVDQMDNSLDKLANIANQTASSVAELMTAAQKSASTANSVGASEDSFLASIATIQSITRESAENIGNGLKSIYTRFADVKTTGSSSEGGDTVEYGQYAQALSDVGVDVLDENGTIKTMDQILTELQATWKTLSDTERLAVGEKVAGRYQYNRFAALMENEDYYEKAYAATQGAAGSMAQMQAEYMERIETQLQKAATNIESIFTSFYRTGVFEDLAKGFADFTGLVSNFINLIDNAYNPFNSLSIVITGLITAITKIGGKSISSGLTNMVMNRKNDKEIEQNRARQREAAQLRSEKSLQVLGVDTSKLDPASKALYEQNMQLTQYQDYMTEAQLEKMHSVQQRLVGTYQENIAAGGNLEKTKMALDFVAAAGLTEDGSPISLSDKNEEVKAAKEKLEEARTELKRLNSEEKKAGKAQKEAKTNQTKADEEVEKARKEQISVSKQYQYQDKNGKWKQITSQKVGAATIAEKRNETTDVVFQDEQRWTNRGNLTPLRSKWIKTGWDKTKNADKSVKSAEAAKAKADKSVEAAAQTYKNAQTAVENQEKVVTNAEAALNKAKQESNNATKYIKYAQDLDLLQGDWEQTFGGAKYKDIEEVLDSKGGLSNTRRALSLAQSKFNTLADSSLDDEKKQKQYKNLAEQLGTAAKGFTEDSTTYKTFAEAAEKIETELGNINNKSKDTTQAFKDIEKGLVGVREKTADAAEALNNIGQYVTPKATSEAIDAVNKTKAAIEGLSVEIRKIALEGSYQKMFTSITNAVGNFSSVLTSVMMMTSSITGMFDTLSDSTASFGDKVAAVANGIAMMGMSLGSLSIIGKGTTSVLESISDVIIAEHTDYKELATEMVETAVAEGAAEEAAADSIEENADATRNNAAAKETATKSTEKNTDATKENAAATKNASKEVAGSNKENAETTLEKVDVRKSNSTTSNQKKSKATSSNKTKTQMPRWALPGTPLDDVNSNIEWALPGTSVYPEKVQSTSTSTNTVTQQDTTAIQQSTDAMQRNTQENIKNAAATKTQAASTSLSTKEVKKNVAGKRLQTIAVIAGSKGLEEEAIAERLVKLGIEKNTAATIASTTANKGRLASIFALSAAQLALAAIAVGVVAAIGYAVYQAVTAPARAAEEATETYDEVTSRLQSVNDQISTLSNEVSELDELKQTFSDLEEGTSEWSDSLTEVNNKVLSLLQTYPELSAYTYKGAKGELEISQEGLDLLQERLEAEEELVTMGSYLAANYADEKEAIANAQEDWNDNYTFSELSGGTLGDSDVSATINPDGTAVASTGFSVANGVEAITKAVQEQNDKSIAYDRSAIAKILDLDLNNKEDKEKVEALVDKADEIVASVTAADATANKNAIALETVTTQILGGVLESNEITDGVVDMASADLSQQYDTHYNEWINNNNQDDFLKAYAEATGVNARYLTVSHWGTDDAKIVLQDGTEVSKKAAVNTIATSQAKKDVESEAADGTYNEITNEIASKEDLGTSGANALLSFKKGQSWTAVDNLTNAQLTFLKDIYTKGIITEENVQNKLGVNSEQWKKIYETAGYENGQDYIEAMQSSLKSKSTNEEFTQSIDAMNNELDTSDEKKNNQYEEGKNFKEKTEEVIKNVDNNINRADQAFEEFTLDWKNDYTDTEQVGAYTKSLIQIGTAYGGMTEELTELNDAQKKYNKIMTDGTATDEEKAKALRDLQTAQANVKQSIVTKDWSDAAVALQSYKEALDDTTSEDYGTAIENVSAKLSELSGTEVNTDWVEKNSEQVQAWLNNEQGSTATLQTLIGLDSLNEDTMTELGTTQEKVNAFRKWLVENPGVFDVNGNADFMAIVQQFYELSSASEATQDQIKNLYDWLNTINGVSVVWEASTNMNTDVALPEDPTDIDALTEFFNQSVDSTQLLGKITVKAGGSSAVNDSTTPSATETDDDGGGSSGGGSESEPTYVEEFEYEKDLYKEINAELAELEDRYNDLNKQRERLTGTNYINALLEETNLLKEQIAVEEQKLKIQQDIDMARRKEKLSEYGIILDSSGNISNYDEVIDNLVDERNALTGSEDTEGAQEVEEKISKVDEAVDAYIDLQSAIRETQQTIKDLTNQIEDSFIEAYERAMEYGEEVRKISSTIRTLNESLDTLDGDDPFVTLTYDCQELNKYLNQNNEAIDKQIALYKKYEEATTDSTLKTWYQNEITALEKAKKEGTSWFDTQMSIMQASKQLQEEYQKNGYYTIGGTKIYDSAQLSEILKTTLENAASFAEELKDAYQAVVDSILDGLSEISDDMERRIKQYEILNDELDHYSSITQLLYGDKAYEDLAQIANVQLNNDQALLAEMQGDIAILKELQSSMAEDSDEWLEVQEQINDLQADYYDTQEDALEKAKEIYEYMVAASIQASSLTLTGGSDIDWAVEEWEMRQKTAEAWLDDINAAYETGQLRNEYLKMLDSTDDLTIQQQITEQMNEQLDYLNGKVKLSQYDLEYARANLEVLQKQIALQEAQRNKSTMKLKRDSQGNYNYVYTADQEDIADAESDLATAVNERYNLTKDARTQAYSDMAAALQEFNTKIKEIMSDANLSDEEKLARSAELKAQYAAYIQAIAAQIGDTESNIVNDFIAMADLLTEEEYLRISGTMTQIQENSETAIEQLDLVWSDGLTNLKDNAKNVEQVWTDLYKDLTAQAKTYKANVYESYISDKTSIYNSVKSVASATNELSASTENFYAILDKNVDKLANAEDQLLSYKVQIQDLSNVFDEYRAGLNQLANWLGVEAEEGSTIGDLIALAESGSSPSSSSSSGSGSGGSGDYNVGDWITYTGRYFYDSYGTSPSGNLYADEANAVKISSYSGTQIGGTASTDGEKYIHIEDEYGGQLGWISPDQIIGLDTGGYTGNWQESTNYEKNGKLAVLHQKELVLNAEETAHILAAVEMVRDMTMAQQTMSFDTGLFDLSSISQNGELQQQVQIDASFPNVYNANEIETALNDLINQATIYANRKF